MPLKKYPKTIHLSEAVNTWGCHYTIPPEDKIHYGFSDLPGKFSLWLSVVSGDAVNQIIDAKLGTIISTRPGSYGGQMRTINVDVTEMETACRKYWKKQNARHERQVERSMNCHYCGGEPIVRTDFFGESVCSQCSS